MTYRATNHPHDFKHYDEYEVEGKSFEQLNHLMYVDRVLSTCSTQWT